MSYLALLTIVLAPFLIVLFAVRILIDWLLPRGSSEKFDRIVLGTLSFIVKLSVLCLAGTIIYLAWMFLHDQQG
jgi:hypothetical protein